MKYWPTDAMREQVINKDSNNGKNTNVAARRLIYRDLSLRSKFYVLAEPDDTWVHKSCCIAATASIQVGFKRKLYKHTHSVEWYWKTYILNVGLKILKIV